jgi:hypothetical protein
MTISPESSPPHAPNLKTLMRPQLAAMDHTSSLIRTRYEQIFITALTLGSSDLPTFCKVLWIALGAEVQEEFQEYSKDFYATMLTDKKESAVKKFVVWMQERVDAKGLGWKVDYP